MIELRQVHIRAGEFQLANLSFQVDTGQYAVLMGQDRSRQDHDSRVDLWIETD